MPLSFEQFKSLRAQGLSPQQIAKFDAGKVPYKTAPDPVKPSVTKLALQNFVTGNNPIGDYMFNTLQPDMKRLSRLPEPTPENSITQAPGFLGRASNLADSMAMKFDATKALYGYARRPPTESAQEFISGQRDMSGKDMLDAGLRTGALAAAPTLGIAGDALHHVWKTGYALRDVLNPQLRKQMPIDAIIRRAYDTDRSTGALFTESGEQAMPKRIAELQAEGVPTDDSGKDPTILNTLFGKDITSKIAREQYMRGLAGDIIDFVAAPEMLGKAASSATAKSLGRSGKAFKKRFKRPPVVETEGVALDVAKTVGPFKQKGSKQLELFGSKQQAKMGKAPEKPLILGTEAGGQKIFPFGKAKQRPQGQQELPFIKAPKKKITGQQELPLKPKIVTKEAKTPFGKKLQQQAVEGEAVPLHPASAGRAAEKSRNLLKNKKGQARFDLMSKKQLKEKLEQAKRSGNKMMEGVYRQALHNKAKKGRKGLFGNRGEAAWDDLTPKQREALKKTMSESKLKSIFGKKVAETKATPKMFAKRVRPSKNIGKMARDTQSEHYGRITKRTVKDGQEYFTITGGSLGSQEMTLPRKQLTIAQLKPRAGAKPSVSPEDAGSKFSGTPEIFKAKPKAPVDPKGALKAEQQGLIKQIVEMRAKKPKGKALIELKRLEDRYATIGRQLQLTPEERIAAIKKGRAGQGKIERLEGYEDLAKPKKKFPFNESGELRFGPDPKKVQNAKRTAIRIVSKAMEKKMTPEQYMAAHTNLSKVQRKGLAPYIDDAMRRIGNIDIARLEKAGSISKKEAEIMARAGKNVGKIKTTVSRAERGAGVNAQTFEMAKKIAGMEEPSAAAISDIPIVAAQKKIQNYMANPEKGIISLLDDVEGHLAEYNQLGKFFGRGLQARKNPVAVNDMIRSLNKLKGKLSGPDEIRVKAIIGELKASKAGAFRRAYDIFHELAINNMLSAAITWSRNVSGTTAAGAGMVGDKLASSLVSAVIPEAATAGTKSYLREVPQMIKGIIQSIPHSTKNGVRYFLYEDTRGVVNHLSKKIAKLRSNRHKLLAERASKGIKISAKQQSAELAAYHAKIKEVVRDVRRIYIQESASRLEEVLPTGRRTIRGARDVTTGELTKTGKVVDAIGYTVNTPSRALIAQDKTFAGAYYGGQSLAAKTRKAIKAKIPLKYVTSEEVAAEKIARLRKVILNTKDKKVIADAQQKIKWYKTLKLNKAEEEAVKDAALYYVFREKLPKKMQQVQDVIVDMPVVNTTFPFLKSNYNFIKFTLDHSPMGVFGLKVKGKKGINVDQMGRVIAGTAFWSYVYKKIKDSGGEIYGAAESKDERNLLSQTGRKEKRIEWKDEKGNVVRQFEFGNLAPVTQPMLFLASIDGYLRQDKQGRPTGENVRAHAAEFVKGLAAESPYQSLEQTVAALDNAVTTYDAYGTEAKQAGAASGLQKFGRRWVSGRLIPNIAAEVSKEGKFFGIPVKKPDRAVYDTRTLGEDLRSRLPVDAWKKDLIRRVDWAGKEVERLPQVSPFNKKFYTGRVVSNDKVFDALFQLEVYPKAPSKTTSGFGFKQIYLTDEERAAMSKKIGPKLYELLEMAVNNPGFKGNRMSDMQRQTMLKKIISDFNKLGYAEARVKAINRMKVTEEGRKALKWKRSKGLSTTPSVFKKRR